MAVLDRLVEGAGSPADVGLEEERRSEPLLGDRLILLFGAPPVLDRLASTVRGRNLELRVIAGPGRAKC